MNKKVYILRHGETEYNRLGIVQGSGVDSELNAVGQRQARLFYEKYKDKPFEVVLTSELQRTHQTVQNFIDAGLKWERHIEINEMNWGIHEGKKGTPESIAEYANIKQGWAQGLIDSRIEGGESARELGQRLQVFVNQLLTRTEEHILVCSHGRSMCGLVTLMMGHPIERMNEHRHSNTGLWIAEQQGQIFNFLLRNDLTHLGQEEKVLY
ncbi:MAG: histidine phosphatase family protein [Bacteroidota bacterium]